LICPRLHFGSSQRSPDSSWILGFLLPREEREKEEGKTGKRRGRVKIKSKEGRDERGRKGRETRPLPVEISGYMPLSA